MMFFLRPPYARGLSHRAIATDLRRDAALLAGVCRATAEAFREVRRRRTVRVGPDGAVREPASGALQAADGSERPPPPLPPKTHHPA